MLLAMSLIGGKLIQMLIKAVINRARPENSLIAADGYAFPSGHATMAIIFFSLLVYSFKDDIRDIYLKNSFILANVIIFLLIGFSRIYLNVHWLSDVIGGYALGMFVLTYMILMLKVIGSLMEKRNNVKIVEIAKSIR